VKCRLGTRGSRLARWQADWVAAQLAGIGVDVEIVRITTTGDARQRGPIEQIGSQGVFTKEIQRALLSGEIDVAVHSLKDLPTESVPGLGLAAVPERESPADVLVSSQGKFDSLPPGACVGTGSIRRRAQLLYARADLSIEDIRGNVETRLEKLDEGQYDAIVLAEAGLLRLELEHRISELLPRDLILPAVGQGALGIETRSDDHQLNHRLSQLNHADSWAAVTAERMLLATLRGGCLAPIGAYGYVEQEQLYLDAVVLDRQGTCRLAVSVFGPTVAAQQLGMEAAENLLLRGAADLIERSR